MNAMMAALQELGSYEARPEPMRKLGMGANMFLAGIYYQYNEMDRILYSVGIHAKNVIFGTAS